MRRIAEWIAQKFGPVKFAVAQDRHGNWRVVLIRGHMRFLNPKLKQSEQAVRLYKQLTTGEIDSNGEPIGPI